MPPSCVKLIDFDNENSLDLQSIVYHVASSETQGQSVRFQVKWHHKSFQEQVFLKPFIAPFRLPLID